MFGIAWVGDARKSVSNDSGHQDCDGVDGGAPDDSSHARISVSLQRLHCGTTHCPHDGNVGTCLSLHLLVLLVISRIVASGFNSFIKGLVVLLPRSHRIPQPCSASNAGGFLSFEGRGPHCMMLMQCSGVDTIVSESALFAQIKESTMAYVRVMPVQACDIHTSIHPALGLQSFAGLF